jgi:hypothetical protein
MKKTTPTNARLGTYLTLGVGAGMIGSQSSDAAIVYWDITPMTVTTGMRPFVNPLTGDHANDSAPNTTPTIGLNFKSGNYIYSITELSDDPVPPSIAFGDNDRMFRFLTNDTIGVSSAFKTNWSYMDRPGWTTAESDWATGVDGTSGYVGFSFDNAGTVNYGWLAVTYNAAAQTLVVGDFAYENSGASILAGDIGVIPEPSSLGLLALGASGLLARRRRQAA